WVLSTFVMFVAAVAVPPVTALMAIRTTEVASAGWRDVAVSVTTVPCRYAVCDGEYVMAAVGFALSTTKLPPLVGVDVITLPAMSMPVLNVSLAVPLPA